MQENINAEEKLSEEQLDTVTGGCGGCWEALGKANRHLDTAAYYVKIGNKALGRGNVAEATTYKDLARQNHNAAVEQWNKVNPGHFITENLPKTKEEFDAAVSKYVGL